MRKWVDEQLVFSVLKPSLGISSSWPCLAINPSTPKSLLVKQSHDNSPLILAIAKTADLREGDLKMVQFLFILSEIRVSFIWLDFYESFGLIFMGCWPKLLYNFIIIGIHNLEWIREILYMIILSTQEVFLEQPSAFQPRRQHALLWFSSHQWEMAQPCLLLSHRMTMKTLLVLPKPTTFECCCHDLIQKHEFNISNCHYKIIPAKIPLGKKAQKE